MDFRNLSPLELMALADRERVHTALLEWLLGEHSPLLAEGRARLAARIAGTSPVPNVTRTEARTEVASLDLLVLIVGISAQRYLAVEAKLKSSEHSDQLLKYGQGIARLGVPCDKVLLTLEGTPPSGDSSWRAVSYAELGVAIEDELRRLTIVSSYATDYLVLVQRLSELVRLVSDEHAAATYFNESLSDPPGAPGLVAYVRHLRLHKIMQQIWMSQLGREVAARRVLPLTPAWTLNVGENKSGAANLNFVNTELHPGFSVGLQVQHRAMKMYCHPHPYPNPATQAQIDGAVTILAAMIVGKGANERSSSPRNRGFTSVTLGKAPAGRNLAQWVMAADVALTTTINAA